MLLVLIAVCAPVAGQIVDPPWLAYERGLQKMEAGEFGEALEIFRATLANGLIYPEIEIATGDIYRIEGETALARRHYEKAYAQRQQLRVPEDRFTILYRLESLYRDSDRYAEMADTLVRILKEDEEYYTGVFLASRDTMRDIFFEGGLDRVIQLYRFPNVLAAAAHSRLAWYYSRSGRPLSAVSHALFAVTIKLTETIVVLTEGTPSYRFSEPDSVARRRTPSTGLPWPDTAALLSLAYRNEELRVYLRESGVAEDLYNLAAALSLAGESERARAVWQTLASSPLEGRARDLADRQLVSPFAEPPLEP
jgi:tetratricopeptide (TPR) repeat protein